jgi:tetraacyldisaccharide 4'-kinase
MSLLKPLVKPLVHSLGFLYEKASEVKNGLYDQNILSPVRLPVPVVSIGNLTVGGTGKTPLTHFCLQWLNGRGTRCAVVSRNYGAEVREIAQVDVRHLEAAKYFGDEPVLLAYKNPGAAVFVGPRKYQTAPVAFERARPEIVLVDDGFQHRKLARDLDIVILDATEAWSNYRCVPEGRAREPWASLQRADLIFISKVNLAGPGAVDRLLENLQPFEKPVAQFAFETGAHYDIHSLGLADQTSPVEQAQPPPLAPLPRGTKAVLVSGIGRPLAFEKNLQPLGLNVVEHFRFQDHYKYGVSDIAKIVGRAKALGGLPIITTEKDAVKLLPLWPKETPLRVAPLEVRAVVGEEAVYEILDQVISQSHR